MRVLLPAEIELCKAVGLTEQEYWDFVRLNEAYNGERSKAYAHVPDVQNGPVVPILVNLVIGIALSAIAALLAPKPRAPEERKQPNPLQTEDQTSRSKFAPQSQFDSIQQLAVLGSVIPLVYCSTEGNEGGVRVNSTLLWSYMTTLGRSQQLRALMLFSHGTVASQPDFDGYAIGDLLINNYALGKAKLFFATGGGKPNNPLDNRFLQSVADGQYGQGEMQDLAGGSGRDPFAVEWGSDIVPFFSGARTPGTQTQFGTYAPMPNGSIYKVPYELVLQISNSPQVKIDNATKVSKVAAVFPRFPYIDGPDRGTITSPKGTIVQYLMPGVQHDTEVFQPWGSNEIRQATDDGRFEADGNLLVGEIYMVGTGYGVCIQKIDSPWRPGALVVARIKLTTDATYSTFNTPDGLEPANTLLIQRAAVATISNNRVCDRTDLIIKSIVYRRINGFANVNSEPSNATIGEYEEDDSQISLGAMNVYNKRLSFFALQYRNIGDTDWQIMTGDKYFCVLGRTPEAVYNMITIIHPKRKQYEYQLIPIAGNAIERFRLNTNMYFLEAASTFNSSTELPQVNYINYNSPDGMFTITYTGQERLLDSDVASNGEWVVKGYPGPGIPVGVGSRNLRPRDGISDYKVYEAEEMSNASAPEHEVVSVNELLEDYGTSGAQYTNLAYAGIRLNSGVEWSSFSEISAYFKNGIKVTKLLGGAPDSTNLLPEIAYDLLTNTDYGVGDSVGSEQVNEGEMAVAANFCKGNGFFWNGVIGERVNIREWIYEQAGYCLLQFRIKGGQFSLYPDVPFNSNGAIAPDAQISASAIFTDGTMSDLKVSFLSPEERQLFKATVLWRQDVVNGFPQTRTVTVKLRASSDSVPEETFDMAGFCTSEEHAVTFAKYALKIRQLVDHGITFQTTPQLAMQLEPGQYFQVATAVAHPRSTGRSANRFKNGSISSDGTITGLKLKDGAYPIQYWVPGTEGLRETTISVKGGSVADVSLRGSIFAVATQSETQTRMYKVESLTYAEDGLVEVAGSFTPLIGNRLAVLNWDGQFDVISS